MKLKGIAAMGLALALSASMLAVSAFAAAPDAGADAETAVQEMQKGRRDHGRHGEKQRITVPENAIGKDAAKATALADAGITAEQAGKVRSRVSQLDDGTVVYKVRFSYDGQEYSYRIEATTGAVLDKSAEAASEVTTTEAREYRGHGRAKDIAEPENAIGKDTAKAEALADAGITAEQAGKVRSRVSQLDDGTVVYKVRFSYDGQQYSYQINATTGAVIDKSTETSAERTEMPSHLQRKSGQHKSEKNVSNDPGTVNATA